MTKQEDSPKVSIEIIFTAEMIQEYLQDAFEFEPTIEAVKEFFNQNSWIAKYLHNSGWELITNHADKYFLNTALFQCKKCGKEVRYSKAEGFGQMQIERFNVMKLCEDCLLDYNDGED